MQIYNKYFFCLGFLGLFFLIPNRGATQTLAENNENMHFGLVIGGVVNTTFPCAGDWEFASPESKVGVGGGAFFQYDFAKRFYVQAGVEISGRKLAAAGTSADTALGSYNLKYTYTNISVPVGIGVRLLPKTSDFNINIFAGAIAALPQEINREISVSARNVEKAANIVGVGAMLDLQFQYRFVFLSFRYEFIGTNIFKYAGQAFRTGTFCFNLGFRIF